MMQLLKPYMERFPLLASTYRQVRDQWRLRQMKARSTPWGFTLLGDDSMVDGRFEPAETELVNEFLSRVDVFVDVGAHVGFFTCLAGSRGVRTVSVEPLPNNLACLYANLRDNRLTRAEVFPMGVAHEPGLRTLYGASTGASLLAGWSNTPEHLSRTISVNTLDTLLRGRFEGERLFVKMDIEGGEYDALRGAAETLARSPAPAWLIEICLTENLPAGQTNPHFADVFATFRERGYECRTVDAERRLVTADDVARWVQHGQRDFGTYNFIFTRPAD